MCFWFIGTVSIRVFTPVLQFKRTVIETTGMKLKTSMHTRSVKADLLDSMEKIVHVAKKSDTNLLCLKTNE